MAKADEATARIRVLDGPNALSAARRAAAGLLRGWGFRDQDWLDKAMLVFSEVVGNAVRHAGGCREVVFQVRQRRVTLAVTDASVAVPRRRVDDDTGGRGLLIIEAVAARWGVEPTVGGKRFWVELSPCPS